MLETLPDIDPPNDYSRAPRLRIINDQVFPCTNGMPVLNLKLAAIGLECDKDEKRLAQRQDLKKSSWECSNYHLRSL